jgi:hypothetical protein
MGFISRDQVSGIREKPRLFKRERLAAFSAGCDEKRNQDDLARHETAWLILDI